MKRIHLSLIAALGLSSFALAQDKPAPAAADAPAAAEIPTDPETIRKESSYGFGFQSGRRFASETARYGISPDDIERDLFVEGFFAAFAGEDPGIEQAKLQASMRALGNMLQNREKEIAKKNLEEGKKHLAENKKREGVITTTSGLQYEVLEKGGDRKYEAPEEGKTDHSRFLVNYKGTLIDGTQIDASPEGQPRKMDLQVIPGFKEALTAMPVGAKWRLHIPSDLAYGEQRRSALLAPNSTLIFDLELVDIQIQKPPRAVSPPIQIPPPAKPE